MPNEAPTNDAVIARMRAVYPYEVNLANCDVEPLHHIQVIQPHACVLALHLDKETFQYVTENTEERIGKPWETIMDQPLSAVFEVDIISQINIGLNRDDGFARLNPFTGHFTVHGDRILKNIIAHKTADHLILTIEPSAAAFHSSEFQLRLGKAVQTIQALTDLEELYDDSVRIIRRLTGYDRVMLYRFDDDYNGEVIAEAKSKERPPYLGLRYPHTDIPKQARALYLRNQVRLVGSVARPPARLIKSITVAENHNLDLSVCDARGVSPIHLEYLYNMGVNATMSVAIILHGRLWGLFALHHYEAKIVDYNLHSFLRFFGQIFSGHLALQEANAYREKTVMHNMVQNILGDQVDASQDLLSGLTTGKFNLLNIISSSSGAAGYFEGKYQVIGNAPSRATSEAIVTWAKQRSEEICFFSDDVCRHLPDHPDVAATAAGIIVVFLDSDRNNWLAWFRPEAAREIRWAGQPTKQQQTADDGTVRLAPRKSFAQYIERIKGRSDAWKRSEIDAALALRAHVVDGILRRFTSVRQTNEELKAAYEELESFSYTVSHDLRAPLRAINGFAEILAEDYRSELDDEGRYFLDQIQENTQQMNQFITDLLSLSRVGRVELVTEPVDVDKMARSIVRNLNLAPANAASFTLNVFPNLPALEADPKLARQLLVNLLTNAFKYGLPTDGENKLVITLGHQIDPKTGKTHFFISNTGTSIPPKYHESIFEVFTRLVPQDQVEGTGIGLAIVRRIVQRHNGWIKIDDTFSEGVKFDFALN